MANIPMNNNSIQMSTPINSLPLKTNNNETLNIGQDPDIDSVLKDFEKYEQKEVVQSVPTNIQPVQQVPIQQIQHVQPVQQDMKYDSKLNFNNDSSIFDLKIVKHVFGLVAIVAILYNTSLFEKLLNILPLTVKNKISGYELYIHLFILFIIFYSYEKYLSL